MNQQDRGIDRILIVHPEATTRRSLDEALRRLARGQVAVYEAASLQAGLQAVRSLDPQLVLLNLDEERSLALEVVREVHRGRWLVGLYNPLVARGDELEFLRQGMRAGIRDCVPLPAADAELLTALRAAQAETAEIETTSEGRAVTFFSHKGGVGTTTLAVNTALALAQRPGATGEVVLCDAVVQLGNAAAFLGLTPDHDLHDLVRDLDEMVALPTYLAEVPESGLRVLASPRDPVAAEHITPEDLSRVLIELRRRFPLVVVDAPSHLDALTLAVLDLSETIFIVTEATTPAVGGTARLLELLDELQIRRERVQVVLNLHSSFEGNWPESHVAQQLGRPVSHVIPYDKAVVIAAHRSAPLLLGRSKSGFVPAVQRLAAACAKTAHRTEEAMALYLARP